MKIFDTYLKIYKIALAQLLKTNKIKIQQIKLKPLLIL